MGAKIRANDIFKFIDVTNDKITQHTSPYMRQNLFVVENPPEKNVFRQTIASEFSKDTRTY